MATKNNNEVKPGWKTTEFWVTLVVTLCSLLWGANVLDPEAAGTANKIFGFVVAGCHLRVEGGPRQRAQPPPDRVQLPLHLHPRRTEAGGAHREVQVLQGFQRPHPRVHGLVRPRHRYRARER